jgi:hypothetical protein
MLAALIVLQSGYLHGVLSRLRRPSECLPWVAGPYRAHLHLGTGIGTPKEGSSMLPEPVSSTVFVLLVLGVSTTTTLRMILGVLVICRARRRDLPKIVDSMGTWFWKRTR